MLFSVAVTNSFPKGCRLPKNTQLYFMISVGLNTKVHIVMRNVCVKITKVYIKCYIMLKIFMQLFAFL